MTEYEHANPLALPAVLEALTAVGLTGEVVPTGGGCEAVAVGDLSGRHVLITDGDAGVDFGYGGFDAYTVVGVAEDDVELYCGTVLHRAVTAAVVWLA